MLYSQWKFCLFLTCFVDIDAIQPLDQVWVFKDNSTAISYRKHFLLRDDNRSGFMKSYILHRIFCNSKYSSTTKNMILHIHNTVAVAINDNTYLPKYMIFVVDDDLITYLDFKGVGVAQLLGTWIEWLMKHVHNLVSAKKGYLPDYAKKANEPSIYWCVSPTHLNFSLECNNLRKKLNFCLELVGKISNFNMRVIKLKEKWDYSLLSLVKSGRNLDSGMDAYWDAVDSAFHFNALKWEKFLTKMAFDKLSATNKSSSSDNSHAEEDTQRMNHAIKENHREDSRTKSRVENTERHSDEIQQFFKRHHNDRFHWSNNTGRQHQFKSNSNNRFILPRPKF